MNFVLAQTNQHTHTNTNTQSDYKQITEQFCNDYYSNFDNNFSSLYKYYKDTSLITFMDQEFTGFNQLINFLNSQFNSILKKIGIITKIF